MTPFVQSFTQNLKPCSGCGSSAIDYFIEQRQKGENVKYILQVEAETETEDGDLFSLANGDRSKWKVIGGTPQRPAAQPTQPIGRVVTSPFQQTQTIPTPKLNG